MCRGKIVLLNQDLGSPTPSAQASNFFISRRPSATTAKPKDAPESISQTMSRTWNKSNVGLRPALKKASMPAHASAIHLFVSIFGASHSEHLSSSRDNFHYPAAYFCSFGAIGPPLSETLGFCHRSFIVVWPGRCLNFRQKAYSLSVGLVNCDSGIPPGD